MGEPARVFHLVPETLPKNVIRRANGQLYGCVNVEGHQVRKSLGTRDPIEAEKLVQRWLAEISPRHHGAELSFAQVASSWIEAYRDDYADSTWRRYKTSLKMLNPFFGELYWSDVTRSKINEYIAARKAQGVTTATINRDLAPLSNIIQHALDQEWSEENPLLHIGKKKRKEKRDPFTLPTDEMIEWVWRHMTSSFGDIARWALETGMRMGEIVGLDKKLNLNLDQGLAQLFHTKRKIIRVVKLTPAAIDIAERQPGSTGLVFRTRSGGKYKSASTMWRATIARAAKSWSDHHPDQPFVRFRFHDLRHIYAIRYLRSGGNLYILQKQLGHSTIKQTEGYLRYLSADEQLQVQWSDH